MRKRTLVTGFGPFLDVVENPSARLAVSSGYPHEVIDVSYDAVEDFIFHLEPCRFDRLLMMGVACGRSHLCAELFARNQYGLSSDIRGTSRSGPIQLDQPHLLSSTMFGDEILSDLLIDNPRMRLSLDAGSYLCNFAYFKALAAFPGKQVGFLHIPTFDRIPFEAQLASVQRLVCSLESLVPSPL